MTEQSAAKQSHEPRRSSPSSPSPPEVAELAAEHLARLTGKRVEGVTSLERADDGWRVGVEVVEGARVPSSADLLAVYEIDVDQAGDLQGYRRARRYSRGSSDGGGA